MSDEQKWSDISKDMANVAKKIKSNIDEEDLVEDLKDTFKNTIENTSQLINNIIKTVETSVTDEEIKKETKEIVNNINSELKNLQCINLEQCMKIRMNLEMIYQN